MTIETQQDPVGPSWVQIFLCLLPPYLFVGNGFHSASQTFPEFQRTDSNLLMREGRGCRNKGGAVKKQKCSLGAGSWFLLKEYT